MKNKILILMIFCFGAVQCSGLILTCVKNFKNASKIVMENEETETIEFEDFADDETLNEQIPSYQFRNHEYFLFHCIDEKGFNYKSKCVSPELPPPDCV
ncbi:MAG: hypothetical protein R2852_06045 [Bacteroidia bacterium]